MAGYQAKKAPTTSTTTPPIPDSTDLAVRAGGGGGSSTTGMGNIELDVTDIFGPVATKDGVQNRVVMNADELAQILARPRGALYVKRQGNVVTLTTAKQDGFKPAATRLQGMFGKNAAGRREGMLKLQYYMEVMGVYGSSPPLLGTWGGQDYQALANMVQLLGDTNRYSYGPGGRTTPAAEAYKNASGRGLSAKGNVNKAMSKYLDLGGFLKEQAEKSIAIKKADASAQAAGGGGAVYVSPKEEITSKLDDTFRTLIGRNATAAEKAQFVGAFQADQIAAGTAANRASGSADSPQTELERLQRGFEQAKVDPLVKFNNTWVRASQVPEENRAEIIRRYNVDYNQISRFYADNAQAGNGRSTAIIAQPSLAASAEAAAKANPKYQSYQMGQMGQAMLDMFTGNGYRVNPDIRTG